MKKAILIILAFIYAYSLDAQNNMEMAKQEVNTFLNSLATNVGTDNYKMFGLKSPEEAKQLQADQVFSSTIITLDRLKKYEGTDAKDLVTNIDRFVCTVINRQTQQTVGIVDLEYQKERYMVKGYASSDVSAALGRIDKQLLKQNFSLVRVPALNVYFGSFTGADNQMKFVSLQNNPTLRTEIGEIRPAAEFLKHLVPLANQYNGLPW
jgi:hypothetical protein